MKRAQHFARPSHVLATDDLGVLREGDESGEDTLRRQLMDKEREIDKVSILGAWKITILCVQYFELTCQALQDQLSQRPPIRKCGEKRWYPTTMILFTASRKL